MNKQSVFLSIMAAAAATCGIRFLPFLLFQREQKAEGFIGYLGKVLPYSVMAMLVVFCLRKVNAAGVLPTALGVFCVAVLQRYKRNTLLSIIGGTAVYMLLLRVL